MIKKFISGRDKDLKDLSLLFSHKEQTDLTTIQRFFPDIVEDYKSELLAILFEKQFSNKDIKTGERYDL